MEVRQATVGEIEQALAGGKQLPPLVQLGLDLYSCASESTVHEQFYATMERGFNDVLPHIGKYSGTCSLVGAGPSIKETYKDLVGDVMTVNSALWFLLEKNIVPKWHVIWDAFEVCEKFAIPNPDITYLIASRCHPKVFERLKDCNVIVWHAGGDHDIADILSSKEVQDRIGIQPMINGGSAGVTRGMFVLSTLGYKDIHIFGGDSSYGEGDQTHIMGSVVKEKDMVVSLGDGSPGAPMAWFRTTPEWCQQVNEFRTMFAMFAERGLTLTVHGEGMMVEMYRRLKAELDGLGLEKFVQKVIKQEELQTHRNNLASGKTTEEPVVVLDVPEKPLSKE